MISIAHLRLSALNVPLRDIFQVFNTVINMSGKICLLYANLFNSIAFLLYFIIIAIQIKEKYCDIYLIEHSVLRNLYMQISHALHDDRNGQRSS